MSILSTHTADKLPEFQAKGDPQYLSPFYWRCLGVNPGASPGKACTILWTHLNGHSSIECFYFSMFVRLDESSHANATTNTELVQAQLAQVISQTNQRTFVTLTEWMCIQSLCKNTRLISNTCALISCPSVLGKCDLPL